MFRFRNCFSLINKKNYLLLKSINRSIMSQSSKLTFTDRTFTVELVMNIFYCFLLLLSHRMECQHRQNKKFHRKFDQRNEIAM